MTDELIRFRLLLLTLAGWISRHQQEVIDYLVEESRILKEQLGSRRLRLTSVVFKETLTRLHSQSRT